MKNIIKWFVNNSVAANLFMILILISGYITLPKILDCLKNESNEILIPDRVITKARTAVERMAAIGR